jgi:acetoin utilization protein AcuB
MHAQDPVNRLMTEAVLSVGADEPAGEVLRLFAGYPIHHLPVTRDGVVVGMLSSADVMKLELFLPKGAASPIEYLNRTMRVEALIRRPVIVVSAHQSVEDAARLMAKHGIHGLPVVDHGGHLLGIITTTDIIHAAISANASGGPAPTVGQTTDFLRRRVGALEEVLRAATRYLSAGQDEHLHAVLLKAIEHAQRVDAPAATENGGALHTAGRL